MIEADVKEFIGKLPALTIAPPTAHIAMLAVRSRLAVLEIGKKEKDLVVERRIIKAHEEWRRRYFEKIYNLTVLQEHGLYTNVKGRFPPTIMAIFGVVVPRLVLPSVAGLMNRNVSNLVLQNAEGNYDLSNQERVFFSELHKHKASFNFVTVDVDEPGILKRVLDVLSSFNIWMVTETSRGNHVVLDLTTSGAREFNDPKFGTISKLLQLGNVEIKRDPQEPIPGTLYARQTPSGERLETHYVKIIR